MKNICETLPVSQLSLPLIIQQFPSTVRRMFRKPLHFEQVGKNINLKIHIKTHLLVDFKKKLHSIAI